MTFAIEGEVLFVSGFGDRVVAALINLSICPNLRMIPKGSMLTAEIRIRPASDMAWVEHL